MHHQREYQAQKAYFSFLKSKGASAKELEQRNNILEQLDPFLNAIPNHGSAYRQAVDILLNQSDKTDWPVILTVIREYFHFWLGDIKTIAAMNQEQAFDVHLTQWQSFSGNLQQLWSDLDQISFSTTEGWACKSYGMVLGQKGYDKSAIETRVKLAKLLLLKLRMVEQANAKDYRHAIDAMLSAFEIPALRHLFLQVVREFYYFWIADPQASDYVKEYG